jgi:hypothetical protein
MNASNVPEELERMLGITRTNPADRARNLAGKVV